MFPILADKWSLEQVFKTRKNTGSPDNFLYFGKTNDTKSVYAIMVRKFLVVI